MKDKKFWAIMLLCGVILCGCGDEGDEKEAVMENAEVVEGFVEASVEASEDPSNSVEVENSKVEETVEETIEETEQYALVMLVNPSWEYYIAEEIETDNVPYQLSLLEQKENQIIDTDEWFERNGLEIPEDTISYDEAYSCEICGDNDSLIVYQEDRPLTTEVDFSEYLYSDDYLKADEDFVKEEIGYAVIEDGILYVSTFHYTYAASAPSNAYITAISLEDYSVLWKTEPLICNSLNFEIVEDVIFCGYGFTAEPDTLYQLDKKTGSVLASETLKSQADYVIYKDDRLYVRTYDTDYIFELAE